MTTTLPKSFRHIRLELAREKDHPQGDAGHGYDILLPLKDDGAIDTASLGGEAVCRVRRFRSDENDRIGKLVRSGGGRWKIDYDKSDDADDELAFHFEAEHFVAGEYVSIREDDGELHTFQVVAVREP
ncbi:hypothetical protein [Methylobrevis pamukkalensis]|uniref:Uncharacterized protein n=1 Tax=Methylobrevis pamukkalensis TaxID=1439726 RepID=A0A1E3H4N1_9HYPH|nr:hypothetical protein [Methylobrevis pamukkalensis]ODN71272.1 hypothetical protein A6302_01387 [Methylobrevis pamukkalensis]